MQPMFSLLKLTTYLHIKVQYLFKCTEVNLLQNHTNITVADLHTHNFNAIQTIVIVFTIVICYCTIVIVVKFDYHPALMETTV